MMSRAMKATGTAPANADRAVNVNILVDVFMNY